MHNVRFYKLPNGEVQLRFFNHPVKDSFPKKKIHTIPTPFPVDAEKFDESFVERVPINKDPVFRHQESVRCSISRTKKNIRLLALSTDEWKYFATFTFSMLEVGNRYNYENVAFYMQKYLTDLRKKFPDVKYLVIPEQHKDGAIHFHGLFTKMDLRFAGHYHHDDVYHDNLFTYGFTDVTCIKSATAVSYYISKYITKDLCAVSFAKKRYWHSYKTLKPLEEKKIDAVIDLLMVKEFLEERKIMYNTFRYDFISYFDFVLSQDYFNDFMYIIDQFYFDGGIKSYEKMRYTSHSQRIDTFRQLSLFES